MCGANYHPPTPLLPGQPHYGENPGFYASAGINAPWPAGTGPDAVGTPIMQTAANLNQAGADYAAKQRQYSVGGLGSTTTGSTGRTTLGG